MKIVVGLDRSPLAQHIVDSLLSRHWPRDCKFYLVHVIGSTTGWFSSPEPVECYPHLQGELDVHIYIKDLAMRLKKHLPQHEVFREILHGAPSDQITAYAKRIDADLIVIGQQGSAKAGGFSLGGIAEAIVNTAHCSVEVVKRKVQVEALTGKGIAN